jgi:hypothetical protein
LERWETRWKQAEKASAGYGVTPFPEREHPTIKDSLYPEFIVLYPEFIVLYPEFIVLYPEFIVALGNFPVRRTGQRDNSWVGFRRTEEE